MLDLREILQDYNEQKEDLEEYLKEKGYDPEPIITAIFIDALIKAQGKGYDI